MTLRTAIVPDGSTLRSLAAGLGFFAGALALSGVFALVRPDLMMVERVEFVGQGRADSPSLRHLSDIRNGTTIWSVDVDGARQGVERHPWVRSATARRVFPDTVRIEVEERTPIALLRLDGLYYVDRDGEVFLEVDGSDLDYPVLTGIDDSLAKLHPDLPRLAVRDALALIDALDDRGLVARPEVSEVAFASTRGFTVHTLGGARIRFGLDGRERQVDRLARLVEQDIDLSVPVLVDLAPASVAIVRPLEDLLAGS
ncbi:MAG: FtsQ-type POTRA domain-containing protein [Proteobacteria bacterium]|nr:FtsQ-type POTRA domain-containing protein [Pseudomonadota bacterium]